MSGPKVSIIIPSHNKGKYLREAVQSALSQTWDNTEVVVIDDNSTDESREILAEINDSRLHVFLQSFNNASAARNFGLNHSDSEFIQFLDADDVLHPEKISIQLADMEFCDDVLGVCNTKSFYEIISEEGKEVDTAFLKFSADPLQFILNLYRSPDKGMVQPNAWLVSRKVIDKAGRWNENITVDDDGEFFCRVILNAKKIIHTDRILNYYRKFHEAGGLSMEKSEKAFRSMLNAAILKKRHLETKIKNTEGLSSAINSLFSSIMVSAYPRYKNIAAEAYAHIDPAAPVAIPVIGGPVLEMMKKSFGWQFAKKLHFFFRG